MVAPLPGPAPPNGARRGRRQVPCTLLPCQKPSAFPEYLFDPLFVITLTTPPVDPPYSAGYPLDLTWTSSTKSASTTCPDNPLNRLVVSMPSTTYRFSAALAPSLMMPLDLLSWFVPGACVSIVVKSRPCGRRLICSARMLVARVLCLTSTSGLSPVTCTVSDTPPTPSEKSTFLTVPRFTSTSACFPGLNPARLALTV